MGGGGTEGKELPLALTWKGPVPLEGSQAHGTEEGQPQRHKGQTEQDPREWTPQLPSLAGSSPSSEHWGPTWGEFRHARS